jgi:AFG3 family protein
MGTYLRKVMPSPRQRNAVLSVLVILALLAYFGFRRQTSPQRIGRADFESVLLQRQAIDHIVVRDGSTAEIFLKASACRDPEVFRLAGRKIPLDSLPGPHFQLGIASADDFSRQLDRAADSFGYTTPLKVEYARATGMGWDMLLFLLPLALLAIFYMRVLRKSGPGDAAGGMNPFSFGRSNARLQERDGRSSVTFADVAGLEEAKTEVKEVVDFLRAPDAYTRLGAKIPKGVIIVGPPGTGKTLLVKAVAGEAGVPFFSISGSEFVEMFVGVGASRVRDLFRRAKEKAPCIVFIDEIDAVGRARGKGAYFTGANDERESTLNQLLTEMDGFGTNSGVIVLAATNRADMLDPALLRPGRFDRHIYLELPGLTERVDIFRVHMRPLLLDTDVDPSFLAAQTPGFSGADIANICNEAALIAARGKHASVGRRDFLDAVDRIVAGLERRSRILSDKEKRIVATHEAGHAIASWLLPMVDPLLKVSVIPRGKTLGAAWYLPEERQLHTAAEMRQRLSALLAGRAAEELVFGEASSGALDDLEKVTRDAYLMVSVYGFDERIGPVSFYDSTGQRDTAFQKPYSEETARLIDEQVRRIVEQAHAVAKEILSTHRSQLDAIAELLMSREVIFREDIEAVLGSR